MDNDKVLKIIQLMISIFLLVFLIKSYYNEKDLRYQVDNLQQQKSECLNELSQRNDEIYNCEETKGLWIDLENQCEIANKQLKKT